MKRTHARMRQTYYAVLELVNDGVQEPDFQLLDDLGIDAEGATRLYCNGNFLVLEFYDQALIVQENKCLLLPRSKVNKRPEVKSVKALIGSDIKYSVD